jgi:hypothetical protein
VTTAFASPRLTLVSARLCAAMGNQLKTLFRGGDMRSDTGGRKLEARVAALADQLRSLQNELTAQKGANATRLISRKRYVSVSLGLASALALMICAHDVSADAPPAAGEFVPRQIPYRGLLVKDGERVTGETSITFELYTSSTGGAGAIWSETRKVPVVNGAFAVDLGDCDSVVSTCTKPLAEALATSPPSLYLAVKVGGTALGGRQRLMSAPYAISAGRASSATKADTATTAAALGDLSPASVQRLITGSCPTGQGIRAIAADGTVSCNTEPSIYTLSLTAKIPNLQQTSAAYKICALTSVLVHSTNTLECTARQNNDGTWILLAAGSSSADSCAFLCL